MENDLLDQCTRWQEILARRTKNDLLYLARSVDLKTGHAVRLPKRAQQACTTQELLEVHFDKDLKSNSRLVYIIWEKTIVQSVEKMLLMPKVEPQSSSELAVRTPKKKIKSETRTSKNNIKNKIKEEISSEIKQESCTKPKFKKSTDSLKRTMTEMEENEKDLPTIEELLAKPFDPRFQPTPPPLANRTRAGVKALRMYEEEEK